MLFRLAADAVVLLHLASIAFIVAGGFLTWKWPWAAFVHLPFAVWGVLVQWMGWVCPLTPLENALRRASPSGGAYSGGFVEHYIVPIVYPPGLTSSMQLLLGTVVLLANVVAYGGLLLRRSSRRQAASR